MIKQRRYEFWVNGDLEETLRPNQHTTEEKIQKKLTIWKNYGNFLKLDWEIRLIWKSSMRQAITEGEVHYDQTRNKFLNRKITKLAHELGI